MSFSSVIQIAEIRACDSGGTHNFASLETQPAPLPCHLIGDPWCFLLSHYTQIRHTEKDTFDENSSYACFSKFSCQQRNKSETLWRSSSPALLARVGADGWSFVRRHVQGHLWRHGRAADGSLHRVRLTWVRRSRVTSRGAQQVSPPKATDSVAQCPSRTTFTRPIFKYVLKMISMGHVLKGRCRLSMHHELEADPSCARIRRVPRQGTTGTSKSSGVREFQVAECVSTTSCITPQSATATQLQPI